MATRAVAATLLAICVRGQRVVLEFRDENRTLRTKTYAGWRFTDGKLLPALGDPSTAVREAALASIGFHRYNGMVTLPFDDGTYGDMGSLTEGPCSHLLRLLCPTADEPNRLIEAIHEKGQHFRLANPLGAE